MDITKQFLTEKFLHRSKNLIPTLCVLAIYFLFIQNSFAANVDANDATWGGLYSKILWLFTGTAGGVISLVALCAGVMGAIFSQHKALAVVAGISIPLTIAFGPAIFVGLSGALV